jgi:hypothetical protein
MGVQEHVSRVAYATRMTASDISLCSSALPYDVQNVICPEECRLLGCYAFWLL